MTEDRRQKNRRFYRLFVVGRQTDALVVSLPPETKVSLLG
jgi:hypothetical protein